MFSPSLWSSSCFRGVTFSQTMGTLRRLSPSTLSAGEASTGQTGLETGPRPSPPRLPRGPAPGRLPVAHAAVARGRCVLCEPNDRQIDRRMEEQHNIKWNIGTVTDQPCRAGCALASSFRPMSHAPPTLGTPQRCAEVRRGAQRCASCPQRGAKFWSLRL